MKAKADLLYVKAMMEILKPTNVMEVQLLNGFVKHMYLAKFLPNLPTEWSRYTYTR